MLTQTLEKKTTPMPDGWSRDNDGFIYADPLNAFLLFGALARGDCYGFALNFSYDQAMSFEAWMDKNGIRFASERGIAR